VVDRLAQLDRPPGVDRLVHEQRAAAGIDLDLERDAELPAIAEHALVVAGQPRRTGVPVEAVIEIAELARAVGELERCAAADGPGAAADAIARLEHGAVVAGLAELVGGGQARHPGAEHHHLGAMVRAALERERLGDRRGADETHRLHCEIGRAVAADLRDVPQEVPTRATHVLLTRVEASGGPGAARAMCTNSRSSYRIMSIGTPRTIKIAATAKTMAAGDAISMNASLSA